MNQFTIFIFEDKNEKFGRPLIEIEIEGICINNFLLDHNLAREYNGEKKLEWSIDQLNKIINY